MSNQLKVILNGHGGRMDEAAKIALIERSMQAFGLTYHLESTQYQRHACEIAKQAVLQGYSVVVAAGGDGTINEVLNGLMDAVGDAGAPPTFGIIPLGTANDLADILGIPNDVAAACERLAQGKTRLIDIGKVNGHYFVNNSAVGLEPVVTIAQNQMRWLKGIIRYVIAAFKVIIKAQSWIMQLEWDGGVYDGPMVLVSVGNGHRSGGAFYMTPQAKVDDGLLDFAYGVGMGRLKMLTLLPKLLNGTHINHPLVGYRKTKTLTITATPATPLQADGEVIDENALKIHYQIIPQKLCVII